MPQAILAVLYIAAVDGGTGLQCQQCAYSGSYCKLGESLDKHIFWLSITGGCCSIIQL
jgi:hypothetical protein